MSNEELQKTREMLGALQQELDTPEKILAFLVEAGINLPSGELAEPYRADA